MITSNRTNNLNLIRLVLALGVIYSHSFPLSLGMAYEPKSEPLSQFTHQQETIGSVAVAMFFLISGMLITASWLRTQNMKDFIMKRVLRIYPGFILSMLFSGAVLWISSPEFRANVGHGASWLLMFIHDCIFLGMNSINNYDSLKLTWKGIFPENPLPNSTNGSLWTIPREFKCYLLVAVFGLFCLFKRRIIMLLGMLSFYVAYAKCLIHGDDVFYLDRRLLTYFLIGICIWLWRDVIPISKWFASGCVVVLITTCLVKPFFSLLLPFLGGYLLLWFGYAPKIHFTDWTRKTDLSYGTYLFAFPIQQLIAMHISLRVPWINFLIATTGTLFIAWFSWNYVEKKFLNMKNNHLKDYDPGQVIGLKNIGNSPS